MTEDQIKYLVDRFLCWRLPKNFNPDAGISYTAPSYAETCPPTGTNLLDATQADAMVRHMIEGMMLVSKEELELLRQWYDAVSDTAPQYLDKKDHDLMAKVLSGLGTEWATAAARHSRRYTAR